MFKFRIIIFLVMSAINHLFLIYFIYKESLEKKDTHNIFHWNILFVTNSKQMIVKKLKF